MVKHLEGSNNKAIVNIKGDSIELTSYDTHVATLSTQGLQVTKNEDHLSMTTLKHINLFIAQYGATYGVDGKLAKKVLLSDAVAAL